MKPHLKLAETTAPDGMRLSLHSHDNHFCIRANGQELMHSAAVASEIQLGELSVENTGGRASRILIGGLGLGFTLKGALAKGGRLLKIDVVELFPAVVEWNKTFLVSLNGHLLSDPRVTTVIGDVGAVVARTKSATYDAIALDIDNGPTAFVQAYNGENYRGSGIQRLLSALKPGGRAAIWSAKPDLSFERKLKAAGLSVRVVEAKLYATAKRATYTIYLADKMR
jgi:spermidine synthase